MAATEVAVEALGPITFNLKAINCWNEAHAVYCSVSRNPAVTSVWSKVYFVTDDVNDDTKLLVQARLPVHPGRLPRCRTQPLQA
jgi:hypothetical protein